MESNLLYRLKPLKSVTLPLVLVIATVASAQDVNMLSNGGFEDYVTPPTHEGQINRSEGWDNVNGYYTVDNNCPFPVICATPDYFLLGSLTPDALGYLRVTEPYEGNGFAYFIATGKVFSEYYENLHYEFNDSMKVGYEYKISFYLSHGAVTDSNYCHIYSNNVGVLFSTYAPYQNGSDRIAGFPQFNITEVITHADWQEYIFSFVADSTYNHITIGNFFPLAETDTIHMVDCSGFSPTSSSYSGYFIDNVSVIALDTVSSVSETAEVLQGITQNLEWLIVTLNEGYEQNALAVLYDMSGKQLLLSQSQGDSQITLNIESLPKGMYLLQVNAPQGQARRKVIIL